MPQRDSERPLAETGVDLIISRIFYRPTLWVGGWVLEGGRGLKGCIFFSRAVFPPLLRSLCPLVSLLAFFHSSLSCPPLTLLHLSLSRSCSLPLTHSLSSTLTYSLALLSLPPISLAHTYSHKPPVNSDFGEHSAQRTVPLTPVPLVPLTSFLSTNGSWDR